jgi:catechol 2,3-dioxygenase-like lactoylglutathione lyase family enzyme
MGMQAAKQSIDIGIVVGDIGRSLAFYQDLLGLAKIGELPLPFGLMHRLAFGESFVKLVDPKKAPVGGPVGLMGQLGFRYLTFQIGNIDEVCAACAAAGVEFEIPKQELMPGVTIAMVRDPDGNIVEFVQRA